LSSYQFDVMQRLKFRPVSRTPARPGSVSKQATAEQLADAPRSGAPAVFTPEQICSIVAMTCEKPSDSERPISQWSQREIADEAVRRGLVRNISQRSVGRFLKKRPTSSRIAYAIG
jgi:putative transposase